MSPGESIRWLDTGRATLVLIAIAAGCVPQAGDGVAARRTGAPAVPSAPAATQMIDAASFGARGDDEFDDTVAIQAALTAGKRAKRAHVLLGAGTFYLSDAAPFDQVCLQIYAAQELTLAGAGVGRTKLVLRAGSDAHLIAISASQGVGVADLSLNGARVGRTGTHGIRVASSTDVVLRSLEIRSIAHYGIGLQTGALRRIRIENVLVDDTGGDGIDFKNTVASNAEIVLRDVSVSRPGQIAPRQAGLDIRGRVELSRVQVRGVPSGATGIRFREDGASTGRGGHGSSLSDFVVEGATGSTGVAIAGNDVTVVGGRVIGTDTGILVLAERARVASVVVEAARYAFRVARPAKHAVLEACRGESSRAGVWLEGRGTLVRGSVFRGNARCGICVRPGAGEHRLVENYFGDNGVAIEDESESHR